MKNAKRTNLAANTAVDAMAALLNNGWLDIYSGVQPATANAAPSGTLLASLRFGSPAFAAGVAGVAAALAISPELSAPALGTAAWYRCTQADHATGVQDGSVGLADANLILTTLSILLGGTVSVALFQLTEVK